MTAAAYTQAGAQPTGARILLVEDDSIGRMAVSRVLGKAGHQVEAVPSGGEAWARLDQPGQAPSYDIVLSDLFLGDIDGMQVLRKARELADPPEVILLTGTGTLHTAIEAMRIGAADYLLKPCRAEDLLARIGEAWRRRTERRRQQEAISRIASGLLRLQGGAPAADAPPESRPPAPSRVQVGALLIDRASHSVSFEGEELSLTPTEYGLLCCLAESAGRMVTYGELVRQVYQHPISDGGAHLLLKTHIHNLRHKLRPELIVNVRSLGYRLEAPERA